MSLIKQQQQHTRGDNMSPLARSTGNVTALMIPAWVRALVLKQENQSMPLIIEH